MGNRMLFQTDQADAATFRFFRTQCQRSALAGVDGITGLCAVAFPGLAIQMEPQSSETLHTHARRLMAKIDLAELLRGYGTAGGNFRFLGQPEQAYFAGLLRSCGTAHAN